MAGMEDELNTLLQRLGGAEVGVEAVQQQLHSIRFVFNRKMLSFLRCRYILIKFMMELNRREKGKGKGKREGEKGKGKGGKGKGKGEEGGKNGKREGINGVQREGKKNHTQK